MHAYAFTRWCTSACIICTLLRHCLRTIRAEGDGGVCVPFCGGKGTCVCVCMYVYTYVYTRVGFPDLRVDIGRSFFFRMNVLRFFFLWIIADSFMII